MFLGSCVLMGPGVWEAVGLSVSEKGRLAWFEFLVVR